MQAIRTTFHASSHRYRAKCYAGSVYINANTDRTEAENHRAAARELKLKLAKEAVRRHLPKGYRLTNTERMTQCQADPWMRPTIMGTLWDRSCVHVFTTGEAS